MAELNKFLRSKERMIEILNHLTKSKTKDKNIDISINALQKSISIIDHKMEEFKRGHRYLKGL